MNLIFNEDIERIDINVTLRDDTIVEGNEDFLARLEILTQATVTLSPDDNAIVTIVDDDSKSWGRVSYTEKKQICHADKKVCHLRCRQKNVAMHLS